MTRLIPATALLLVLAALQPAMAEDTMNQPSLETVSAEHTKVEAAASALDNSTARLKAANEKMHHGMDITYTGNADVDFVRGMIAHHNGAIDMAKVELQYGKDPEIRTLAEGVIKAQEAEVAQMEAWLLKHAQVAPAPHDKPMHEMDKEMGGDMHKEEKKH